MEKEKEIRWDEHPDISVHTHTNGYGLTVCGRKYFYFSVQELLAGFVYHVGLCESSFNNMEYVAAVVAAAVDWKSGGDFVQKEAAKVIQMQAKLQESRHELRTYMIENRNLKSMLRKKGVRLPED